KSIFQLNYQINRKFQIKLSNSFSLNIKKLRTGKFEALNYSYNSAFLIYFSFSNSKKNCESSIKYLLNILLGSWQNRQNHSRPDFCIQIGALRMVPASKSKDAPIPSET